MLSGLAVASAWLVGLPGVVGGQGSPVATCTRLEWLGEVVDLSSPADQAAIRARSVQLAAALQAQLEQDQASGARAASQQDRDALAHLRTVLADPSATSSELVDGLQDLADRCGTTLTVTRTS